MKRVLSLRAKIGFVILAVVALDAGLDQVVQQSVIMPSFNSLERQGACRDAERCSEAIDREVHHLAQLCNDWAKWDEMYKFVLDRNADFIASNLKDETFDSNSVDAIYICDTNGKCSFRHFRPSLQHDGQGLTAFPEGGLKPGDPLLAYTGLDGEVTGILMTEEGPLLVACKPILTTDLKGPSHGTLIMGRRLDDDLVTSIGKQTRVDLSLWHAHQPDMPAKPQQYLQQAGASTGIQLDTVSKDFLEAYKAMPDIAGNPAIVFRATVPRRITAQGTAAQLLASKVTTATSLCMLLALLLLLRRIVLRPLSALRRYTQKIRETADLSLPLPKLPKDEIGLLGESFDSLRQQVAANHALLESKVADRTAKLVKANDELRQEMADRQAAEKEKAKLEEHLRQSQKLEAIGTLAGGIAHDFNNILSAILGYAELGLDELTPENPLHEHLTEVQKAGNRAKELVKQILTFSRKTESEKHPVQIHTAVKEALNLLRHSVPANIEFVESIDRECGMVLADLTQIHQIMMNLGTNACHAMKSNGGTLDVRLERVAVSADRAENNPNLHEGDYICLSTSDTGHGIPPEVQARMFEPFFTTKPVGEGTGLGLSTIHGIVKEHGGAINVYSEVGRGTTFRIYLPRIQDAQSTHVQSDEPLPTGHESILLVDDEEPLVRMGQTRLTRLGYSVTARTNAVEALAILRAQPDRFDAVITDHMMPEMTGEELAREIKQVRPDILILLTTGLLTAKVKGNELFAARILKPVETRDLALILRKALDRNSSEETATATTSFAAR